MHPSDRDDWDEDDIMDFSGIFREIERMMGEAQDAGFGDDVHFRVDEEDDLIRVVGDLPGVEKKAIEVKCDGKHLTVEAHSDHREYRERIDLPAAVDEHSARASFNNGVIEIVLERTDESTGIDLG